jgi:hypothetical protein
MPALRTYQAQFSLPASLVRVQAASSAIERLGGRIEVLPTGTAGVTTVRIHLPPPYVPEDFLPGLPFYPA